MTDTLITVQGRFSAWYPAERATLRFAVGFDGADRSTVFSATTGSGEIVRNRIATIHDPRVGPITWWSSDNVQVWSDRPWIQHGLQLGSN